MSRRIVPVKSPQPQAQGGPGVRPTTLPSPQWQGSVRPVTSPVQGPQPTFNTRQKDDKFIPASVPSVKPVNAPTLQTVNTPTPAPEYVTKRMSPQGRWIETKLPYQPSYWEHPDNVNHWYQEAQNNPNAQLPEGMDKTTLEGVYNYMKVRNEGRPVTDWQYLNTADPMREFMSALPQPVTPQQIAEQQAQQQAIAQQPADVMAGKANWVDLPLTERQKILSDPAFDIAKYPAAVRPQILGDQNFDWSHIPAWQKMYWNIMSNPAIMASPMALAGARAGAVGGVPGAIVGAAVGYGLGYLGGQQFNPTGGLNDQPTIAAKGMYILNALTAKAEQSIGFAGQAIKSPQEVMANPQAAWEAGRFTYEYSPFANVFANTLQALTATPDLLNAVKEKYRTGQIDYAEYVKEVAALPNPLGTSEQFAGPGQNFIIGRAQPVDVGPTRKLFGVGPEILNEDKIIADVRNRIAERVRNGESINVATNEEFAKAQETVGGQLADLGGQMFFDPLQVLPKVESGAISKVAELTGHDVAAQAFAGAESPIKGVQEYASRIKNRAVPETFDYKTMPVFMKIMGKDILSAKSFAGLNSEGKASASNWFGRLLGNDEALIAKPEYASVWNNPNKLSAFRDYMGLLQPESRALEGHHMAQNNLMQMFNAFAQKGDIEGLRAFYDSVRNGDMVTAKDIAGRLVDSPEMYTILPALKEWNGYNEMFNAWDASVESRNMLGDIARLLGDDPAKVLDEMKTRPDRVFEQIKNAVGAGADSGAAYLKGEIDAQRFTILDVQHMSDMFNGTDKGSAVPWNEKYLGAALSSSLTDHFAKWGMDYFGIKGDNFVYRLASTAKKVQSLLMMGYSPGTMINNGLNNMMMRAATGNFGFMSEYARSKFFEDFGYMPHEGTEAQGPFTENASALSQAISKQKTGEGVLAGPLTQASRFMGALSDKSMLKINRWVESLERSNALTISMKQMWGRIWERGKGFSMMDQSLAKTLDAQYPGASNFIYDAIESGMNFKQVEEMLQGRSAGMKAQNLVDAAAQSMGMKRADAVTLLDQLGVMDSLNEALKGARSEKQIDAAFARTTKIAESFRDIRIANDLQPIMENVFNRVRTEGPLASGDIFVDNEMMLMDRWVEHYVRGGETASKVAESPIEMRGNLWDEYYSTEGKDYNRANSRYYATLKGLADALGLGQSEGANKLLALIAEQAKTWDEAYKYMRDERNGLNAKLAVTEDPVNRNGHWDEYNTKVDTRFNQARDAEAANMQKIGRLFADEFEARFGKLAGDVVADRWKNIMDFRGEMWQRLQEFRTRVKMLTGDEARAAKAAFYKNTYMPMIEEMRKLRSDFGDSAQKAAMGQPVGPNEWRPSGTATQEALPTPKNWKEEMAALGYDPAEIDKMSAQQAWTALDQQRQAALKQTAEPVTQSVTDWRMLDDQKAQVAAQQRQQSVAAVTQQHGMPLANEDGTPNFANQSHVKAIVNKYGGGGEYKSIFDVPPDVMEKAFTERQRIIDMQGTLDSEVQKVRTGQEIIAGLTPDRRTPANELLRNEWPSLHPDEQAEVMSWLTNKTMVDQRTGLETLAAMDIGGGKPQGWVSGASDLNGMKGINDTFGHPAGDAVLGGMGDIINEEVRSAGGRAFRVGGDEVSYWFPDEATAKQVMQAVDARMKDAIITLEIDGQQVQKKGFSISYGYGQDEHIADAALYVDKARRLQLGERPEQRGALPGSIRTVTAGEQGAGQVHLDNVSPEEVAARQTQQVKQQGVLDLVQNRPLNELPPVIQEPVRNALLMLLDEVRAGHKKSLTEFIKEKGGLDISQLRDLTGEEKVQRAWGPGLFKKGGMSLDDMVTRMVEDGYLTKMDVENPNDNGGMNRATELIRQSLAGDKAFSAMDESKPVQTPDWYKNVKGKNKQATVEAAILRMLNGNENTAFGLDASAIERTIKAEAYNRLGDQAAVDGRLADMTGYPFNFDNWSNRLNDAGASVDQANLQQLEATSASLDTMIKVLPDNAPEDLTMKWVDLNSRVNDQLDVLRSADNQAQLRARADAEMQAGVARGEAAMTRELWREKLTHEFNLDNGQADSVVAITDARAEAWAKANNTSADEWYKSRLADVVKGGGEGDLSQLQPSNRAMTADEVNNYARALVRAGADELRRAVTNENNPADRVALLDAAHQLDPKMAESVASQTRDMLYQNANGPVWISKLTQTVESIPMDTMTVEQLRGLVNKGGVKADEMKWTGFDDFLKEHKGKVTKAEALKFLQENQVNVQEVTYPQYQRSGEVATGSRYKQYVVPGGENYREVLFTLPTRENGIGAPAWKQTQKGTWAWFDGEKQVSGAFPLQSDAESARASIVANSARDNVNYQSPHWNEPNVLAHVRLDDRVDAQGKRVLFVEEVQSDWHQQGREKGYQGQASKPAISDVEVKFIPPEVPVGQNPKNYPGYWESVDKRTGEMITRHPGSFDKAQAIRDAYDHLMISYENTQSKSVPAAPFSKTWPELVMKRVLRMAAEDGYDKVAWTTGEQQAARYDLRKQVDRISYTQDTGEIQGLKDNQKVLSQKGVTPENLADYIGKEAAAKLLEQKPNTLGTRSIAGDALAVGGQGMKGFYDQMLPAFMDKYGKKWGAKVGETEIAANPGKDWQDRFTNGEPMSHTVHSVDVTQAMKDSVLQGQPLFQNKKGAVSFLDDGRAVIHAFEGADVSTVVHEVGHIFRRDLQGIDLATIEEWVGVKDGVWKRTHEEKFARAFEKYLADGKAPTPKLVRVFEAFKTWLTTIYSGITGSAIDVNIPENVRKVFDRMLADEAQKAPPQPSPNIRESAGVFGEGATQPGVTQTSLFQNADPRMPNGYYDQQAGFLPEGYVLDEGWKQYVEPLLAGMKDEAKRRITTTTPKFDALDPTTQTQLRNYLNKVRDVEMPASKNATVNYGESQRDFALLNYNRQYGFDKQMQVALPYELWYTRTMMNMAPRLLDAPSWFANYARLRNMQNTYTNNLPERLRNKIKIPLPFLPEWTGQALYIDPLRTIYPFDSMMSPIDMMNKDKTQQQSGTERILQGWAADGTISDAQVQEALSTQSGATWNKAFAEAQVQYKAEISNPLDFVSTMLGPAWYLTNPWYDLTGGLLKGRGDTNLPITNAARALETVTQGTPAEPVGKFMSLLAKPEEMARAKAGLPQYGEYGDYYLNRQLANMAAEGLISPTDANKAMIERQGPIFEQALQRMKLELAMKVPLMSSLFAGLHADNFAQGVAQAAMTLPPSLFGAGMLPEGELKYRGLYDEWNAAWKKKDGGDSSAITNFFNEHPEYEAYLAKGKPPEQQLRSFLTSQIWDTYMGLDKVNQKLAVSMMGKKFNDSFLNKETRNYDSLDVNTLATWAKMLNGIVPKTPATQPTLDQTITPLPQYDSSVTQLTDQFYAQRTEKFPHYYALQSSYYALPKSERNAFLLKFPELKHYWDFKDSWYKAHPELKPILNGNVFKTIDTSTWPPMLTNMVMTYAVTGQKLPKGAVSMLTQIWLREGRPNGDFKTWLDSQVAPALMYQISPNQAMP